MIDPDDFLAQAEAWILLSDEASWRSAVSRGYYAAFHEARNLLADLGFQVPHAAQAHSYLWLRLSNCGDPVIAEAGKDLNELSRFRNRADYDIRRNFAFPDADTTVKLARQVIEALALARVEPLRTQVRDPIRDYERTVLRDVTWQGP
jgi:uncharacterized protein (UPF0332 family)